MLLKKIAEILIITILMTGISYASGDIVNDSSENDDLKAINSSSEENGDLTNDLKEMKDLLGRDIIKENHFIIPERLKDRVEFWKNIYSKYTTHQYVIHDSEHLNIVYGVIDIQEDGNVLKSSRKGYSSLLKGIQYKINNGLNDFSDDERRIINMFQGINDQNKFLIASENVRAQLGQKDRFIEGLKRSGRYVNQMRVIFKENGLPEELLALPHVESSFQYDAYSKVGAAGIWQFMRSTGKLFLRVDYTVDDRLDPLSATTAAAKLLKKNYEELQSWPLAVTAYNHGINGMKRAQQFAGNEIADIIDEYKSRQFGFASKNFYSEFLAAREISKDYKKYFGEIEIEQPIEFETYVLPDYLKVSTISKKLNIPTESIQFLNPSLRPPVVQGKRFVPKGFQLKIPKGRGSEFAKNYPNIPKKEKFVEQIHAKWYKVKKGDNLSKIAKRNNISVSDLMTVNNLSDETVYPGQVLQLEIESSKQEKENQESRQKNNDDLTDNVVVQVKNNIITITVDPDDTLWHYSDWSGSSIREIRYQNNLKKKHKIKVGQKINIPLNNITPYEFEEKRNEFHKGIEEDFFSTYQVDKTITVNLNKGQNLWDLCNSDIPCWLLKKYNPDKEFQRVDMDDNIIIPVVSKR